MKTILLIVFGAVSLVVGLSFLVRALYVIKTGKEPNECCRQFKCIL